MNHSESELAELVRLFSALEADSLTEQELARLDARLEGSAEARGYFREFIALHEDLRCMPLAALERLGNDDGTLVAADDHRRVVVQQKSSAHAYLLAVGGTIAACFALVAFLIGKQDQPAVQASAAVNDARPAQHYVASLIEAVDVTWLGTDSPPSVGARLSQGELELESGTASIRFDSGATLVLTGPACIDVKTNASATLNSGQVVFISDGSDLHFTLSTPHSRLMHFGTEYAVRIDGTLEEVHVLDGEVHRVVGEEVTGRLVAGQASVFSDKTSKKIELSPALFTRTASASSEPAPPEQSGDALIAAERFEYPLGERFAEELNTGGLGWSGAWWLAPEFQQTSGFIDESAELASWGSYCYTEGTFLACRFMDSPIRMNEDGLAYISYRFQFSQDDVETAEPLGGVLLVLREPPFTDTPFYKGGVRLRMHSSFVVLNRHNEFARTEMVMRPGVEYCFVGKIVASEHGPDQLLARVYSEEETLPKQEPTSWTVVGPEFFSDGALQRITLHMSASQGGLAIDDIVIGKTWESVRPSIQH